MLMQTLKFPSEITSEFEILQEMGRGAFSTVYKIKSKKNDQIYCLKKLNIKKTPNKENEINILSKLNHPNLVKYISSYLDDEGVYIIMEFCSYGDLYSLLHLVKKKKVYVNEEIIWDIAYQALLGLEYLHSMHVIHRDIKLLNIFMSKDKLVKIGDLGMSKLISNKEMKLSRVGTPLYLAPELVKKEKYDYKADIWSFGCSLYHLAKTIPPFNDENLIRLGHSIVNENPPNLPKCYSEELVNFIFKLMTKNKQKRPSATEALKLIPERIKNKYNLNKKENKNNNLNESSKNNNKLGQNVKSNVGLDINKDGISQFSTNNSTLPNNQKIKINLNTDDKNNNKQSNFELVSGQTFYKFFRNQQSKKKSNQRTSKGNFGSSISSQNNLFDSKNINTLFIMSKTKEGFYKHKNNNTNIKNLANDNMMNSIESPDVLKTNNELNTQKENEKPKQSSVLSSPITDKEKKFLNNNVNQITNIETNLGQKPKIENYAFNNRLNTPSNLKEKILIDASLKNISNDNKVNDKSNNIVQNNKNPLSFSNENYNNNGISNNFFKINNFEFTNNSLNIKPKSLNNKKRMKNTTNFFFNKASEIRANKDLFENKGLRNQTKKSDIVSFPFIISNNKNPTLEKNNGVNLADKNNKMFRKTMNFNFNNKLTIHDLK